MREQQKTMPIESTLEIGTVKLGYQDGVAVLALVGEHDIQTAAALSAAIREQADRGAGVVVSLTETEFIDSSIVRALFQGDQYLLSQGRRLVLHSEPSSPVESVLEIAGVDRQLLCCDLLGEAVEYAAQCYREAAS